MNNICIIPAKGSSHGLPRKNALPLGGYPLVAWQIRSAINSGIYDRVIVSSEDWEIRGIAENYGAEPWIRPHELAEPRATSNAVVQHVLEGIRYRDGVQPRYVTIALPTAPFTGVEGHKAVYDLAMNLDNPPHDYCVHLAASIEKNPPTRTYYLHGDIRDRRVYPLNGWDLLNVDQRQFHPQAYRSTYGATFFTRGAIDEGVWFPTGNTYGTVTKHLHQSIDIDDIDDFEAAKRVIKLNPFTWREITGE